jgi:long-subunit fatty acid transport protein
LRGERPGAGGGTRKRRRDLRGEIGEALEEKAELKEGGVTVRTKLPSVLRGAVRWDEPRWNVETAFVYETWGRNDEVTFLPHQPGGLGLKDEETGLTMKIKEVRLKTHLRDTWSLRFGGERIVSGRLTARGGLYYERAAVAPSRLSASNFDLDKVGLTVGTHTPLPKGLWLDFAAGWSWWKPVQCNASRVRLVDPIAKETRWRVGNGRYSNSRRVVMMGLGIAL